VSKDLVKEYLSNKQTYPRLRKGEVSFSKFLEMNRLDFSRDIVKEPNLTLLFQELSAHFPDCRFVFIVRDPRDNIRSLLNRLDIPGNLPQLKREHRKKITRGWDIVIDGRWLGIKGENYIEMLAERWNLMVDVYVENRDKIILAQYEDFLKDKVGEISRLASELNLTQVNDISDKVDIQYQPRGDREINWQDFFGADNLARIETLCSRRMVLFNYPLTVQQKIV